MQINCLKLGVYRFAADYIYTSHSHRHIEIDCILSGRCIMEINGVRVAFKEGECAVLTSGCTHSFSVDGSTPCRIRQFEFTAESLEGAEKILQGSIRPFYKLSHCDMLYDSIKNLYLYQKVKNIYGEELFSLEFKKLLILLKNDCEAANDNLCSAQNALVKQVTGFIEDHYREKIDLVQVAKAHHISTSYLRRIFASELGFSGIEYITMLRMEFAKNLLKNSECDISQIAEKAGYNSVQFFSTMFKRKIGISPREFRRQLQN